MQQTRAEEPEAEVSDAEAVYSDEGISRSDLDVDNVGISTEPDRISVGTL